MSATRRILEYARPYRLHLVLGILCAGGVSLMTLSVAKLVGPLVDEVFSASDANVLTWLPFAIIGIHFLKGVFRYGQAFFTSYAGQRAVQDMRDALYAHVIRMPAGFFAQRTTGDLISRIVTDANLVQVGFTMVVKNFLQNVITAVLLIGNVIWLSPTIAPVALIGIPLAVFPVARLGSRLKRVAKESQQGLGRISDHIQETVTGANLVRSRAMEEVETERFHRRTADHLRLVLRGIRLGELAAPIMETVAAIGFASIIFLGGREIIEGDMKPGELGQLLTSLGLLYVPLKAITRAYHDLTRSLGASERLFELLDETNEKAVDKGTEEAGTLEGQLRFEQVSFAYPGAGNRRAVHGIDLEVKHGEAVAFVGHSGSGKSTLANLILRFYDPVDGRLSWDGTDVKDFTLASLRRRIGWVSQDVVLFDATVRENILYGNEGASEDELLAAAKAAHALDFIQELPDGFETRIGEKGTRLSGGQKQRLSIARTLLSDPALLVLDEATSALDTKSEGIVQAAIERLMKGRTTIIIAHRLSTIQNVDRIVVLDEGHIVEQGTLAELLEKDGHYCALARGDLAALPKPTGGES